MMVRSLPAIVVVGACGLAVAEPAALEPMSTRTTFFAGREVTLGTVIRGGDAVAGRLVWTLTALGRTLAHGAVDVRHDGGPATIAAVTLATPDVKAGVVIEATFTAVLVDPANARLATHARPVRIFFPNPFVDRTRWLELLRLALVDPVGDTERVLAEAGVPFTLVRSEADIVAADPGIVVVGEGASWLDRPDLPVLGARIAARGVPVLCLAPRDGRLALPHAANGEDVGDAKRLAFEHTGIVAALDPRLDGRDWAAGGRAILSRLVVAAEGDRVVVRIVAAADDPGGWPWLAIDYARSAAETTKSPFIICGYGIMEHWHETPAARYFLAAILERLAADRATTDRDGDRPDSTPPKALQENPR